MGSRYRMSAEGDSLSDLELLQFSAGHDPEKGSGTLSSEKDKPEELEQSDLTGEWHNIGLLLLLYTLQGIPMGISSVFPLVLKERGASFTDLGTFSLNSWPFSLKLFWAPVVDAAYFKRFGRRKTWLVPAQLLIGIVMLVLSPVLDSLLYVEKPAIKALALSFFFLYLLCATQDIAVDGWALTILRKENVGYAATCNSIGQNVGNVLGFAGFMALDHYKIATLSSFIFFWAIVFLFTTIIVAALKSEKPVPVEDEPDDIATAYKQMLVISNLKPVRSLIFVLFTWKVGFAMENALVAKFQEYGVPKAHLAYLSTAVMPVYIILPAVVSKWTAGSTPLDLALKAYPCRLVLIALFAVLACFTPKDFTTFPVGFYALMLAFSLALAVANQCIFVSQMAFFARVSDPAMGGTYMTLLNTFANLGGMWPSTLSMFLIDVTSCKGEACIIPRDGFFVVTGICLVFGFGWYVMGSAFTRRIQQQKASSWKVR